jgi:hypothetical protein
MTQDYKYQYNTYPVFSEETSPSFEPAFKRFSPFPTPDEVYNYALMGLPKYFPLTQEPITVEMVKPFLESAITDIEFELGCNLSPVTHYESHDHIDGLFTNNYTGLILRRWPATEVTQVSLKYPHASTQTPYQTYGIPPGWIYLRRNKMNVVASVGTVTVGTDNSAVITTGGLFAFISGFTRGTYAPGSIEVVYKAGFDHDRLPSSVVDLIKTWAARRWLIDLLPILFPQTGVSVSIDGVAQSVQFNIAALIQSRIDMLEKKKAELAANFVKAFGKTLKTAYLGS